MKLRITQEELNDLTFEQKQNLCDLWIPHLYDVSIATVCVDAAEEKFDQITYVIGGIKLLKHHDILLTDLKFMQDEQTKIQEEESYSSNIASDRIDGIEDLAESTEVEEILDETELDFTFDEDFSFDFQRPESYSKQDCLPLLDIGQMIDILQRNNFGQGEFYLYAAIEDSAIDLGKSDFSIGDLSDSDDKNLELCDILWESVKALL
jgi:hypothetical protein